MSAAESSGDELAEVVARVFPPGTVLGDGRARHRFHVLRGPLGPRWLLPSTPTGHDFLAGWRPYGRLSRLAWASLRRAYRMGALGLVPGVREIGIELPDGAGFEHLGWSGGESARPVIHLGTGGATRKAVVALAGTDGTVALVAKVAIGPLAAAQVINEARVLERLATEAPGLAPRPLFLDEAQGCASVEPVAGRPSGRRLTERHLRWLRALRRPSRATSLAAATAALEDRMAGACPVAERARSLLARDDDRPLPAFWQHGDMAPWNLKVGPGGLLIAVDWEDARADALPLQDLLYYFYNQAYLLEGTSGLAAIEAQRSTILAFMDAIGVPRERLRPLLAHFLVEEWLKRRCRGEDGHARRLADDLAALAA